MNKTLLAIFTSIGALIIIFAYLAYQNMQESAKIQVDQNLKTAVPSMQKVNSDANQQKNLPFELIEKNIDYKAKLTTTEGDIMIDLFEDKTPITVSNFVSLSQKDFYNNTVFHRVIEDFMIQGGDPRGDGTGGPGYKFEDEHFEGQYSRGTIAMANSGPNTNGSQFFIMHKDYPLPPNYVIFGKVIDGLDVVDKIATAKVEASRSGEVSQPVSPVKVLSIEITAEEK